MREPREPPQGTGRPPPLFRKKGLGGWRGEPAELLMAEGARRAESPKAAQSAGSAAQPPWAKSLAALHECREVRCTQVAKATWWPCRDRLAPPGLWRGGEAAASLSSAPPQTPSARAVPGRAGMAAGRAPPWHAHLLRQRLTAAASRAGNGLPRPSGCKAAGRRERGRDPGTGSPVQNRH